MKEADAIVIGGGPAGSAAAARLASSGLSVLLLEEKQMPRHKLCGEFVTPECFPTLRRMGVMERLLAGGAQKIERLTLSVSRGRAIHTLVAEMSEEASWALSLSRARFDRILFDRAREAGADCLEGMAVKGCFVEPGGPRVVEATRLLDGRAVKFKARLVIDASGRNSRLMLRRKERMGGRRGNRLYAFKAHLRGVRGIDDQVELYFFPQGYGGLSRVEDGLVNLCFIVNERDVLRAGRDAPRIVEETIKTNSLARARLGNFEVVGKWHAVGPLTFGTRRLGMNGVIAAGDASGMIDPFTGTGMQMALRTGEMAAESIIEALGEASNASNSRYPNDLFERAIARYASRYAAEFGSRMKAAGLLRCIAFSPGAANFFAGVLASAPWLARKVLRATRSGGA